VRIAHCRQSLIARIQEQDLRRARANDFSSEMCDEMLTAKRVLPCHKAYPPGRGTVPDGLIANPRLGLKKASALDAKAV